VWSSSLALAPPPHVPAREHADDRTSFSHTIESIFETKTPFEPSEPPAAGRPKN
jgi:hypothetical protein